jgi:hypothetical protein
MLQPAWLEIIIPEASALDRKDGIALIAVLALLAIVMKLAFYQENVLVTTRTALALWWLLVVPGYFLLEHWKGRIGTTERIVVGATAAAAVIAIVSYYLGLLGLHLKYHGIVLPVCMMLVGIFLSKRAIPHKIVQHKKQDENDHDSSAEGGNHSTHSKDKQREDTQAGKE